MDMEARAEKSEKPSTGAEVKLESAPVSTVAIPAQPDVAPSSQPTQLTDSLEMKPPSGEAQKEIKTIHLAKDAILQMQIQALVSLQTRIARIRSLPAHLVIFHSQSPLISFGGLSGLGLGDGNGPSESDAINSILNPGTETATQAREMGSQARTAFRWLNDTREDLVKDVTQAALKAARESEVKDASNISLHGRRARKKRRVANADSPAPFPSFHIEMTRIFPPLQPGAKRIEDLDDLVLFIREYDRAITNSTDQSSRASLKLWAPSRQKSDASRRVSDPLVVRVVIRDVTIVFVKLRHWNRDGGNRVLQVESVVAVGPREKKGPYTHSDYMIYQKLSQQISWMVEKEPDVSFPQLVDLLTSYEELFTTHCSVCQRVLPLEGHVPPVARVWKDSSSISEGDRGHWEVRHTSCLHA